MKFHNEDGPHDFTNPLFPPAGVAWESITLTKKDLEHFATMTPRAAYATLASLYTRNVDVEMTEILADVKTFPDSIFKT